MLQANLVVRKGQTVKDMQKKGIITFNSSFISFSELDQFWSNMEIHKLYAIFIQKKTYKQCLVTKRRFKSSELNKRNFIHIKNKTRFILFISKINSITDTNYILYAKELPMLIFGAWVELIERGAICVLIRRLNIELEQNQFYNQLIWLLSFSRGCVFSLCFFIYLGFFFRSLLSG
jgi:hypothetical protein